MEYNAHFRQRARDFQAQLAEHPILGPRWGEIALVLKGSTARGDCDEYSDVDFVLFAEKPVFERLVAEYRAAGLVSRGDGVFLPLNDAWDGHYNLEMFERLRGYFSARSYGQMWEYAHAVACTDPQGAFAAAVSGGMAAAFADAEAVLRPAYLDAQLCLDWMRQPLRRADAPSSLLHCSDMLRRFAQLAFLLDGGPYPHDKWLFRMLDRTPTGVEMKPAILEYLAVCERCTRLDRGLPLDQYPQYAAASALMAAVKRKLTERLGEKPWIEQWYLYV